MYSAAAAGQELRTSRTRPGNASILQPFAACTLHATKQGPTSRPRGSPAGTLVRAGPALHRRPPLHLLLHPERHRQQLQRLCLHLDAGERLPAAAPEHRPLMLCCFCAASCVFVKGHPGQVCRHRRRPADLRAVDHHLLTAEHCRALCQRKLAVLLQQGSLRRLAGADLCPSLHRAPLHLCL